MNRRREETPPTGILLNYSLEFEVVAMKQVRKVNISEFNLEIQNEFMKFWVMGVTVRSN